MGAQYPVLRYPGNISGEDAVQQGRLLGWDEVGCPYEVIDAEYILSDDDQPREDCRSCRGSGINPADALEEPEDEGPCPECVGHTNVYLQYARPENLVAQRAELQASSLRMQQLELRARMKAAAR